MKISNVTGGLKIGIHTGGGGGGGRGGGGDVEVLGKEGREDGILEGFFA